MCVCVLSQVGRIASGASVQLLADLLMLVVVVVDVVDVVAAAALRATPTSRVGCVAKRAESKEKELGLLPPLVLLA